MSNNRQYTAYNRETGAALIYNWHRFQNLKLQTEYYKHPKFGDREFTYEEACTMQHALEALEDNLCLQHL